jgi:hypothetical protein
MKKHSSVIALLLLSFSLYSQSYVSSLYYGNRLKLDISTFQPIIYERDVPSISRIQLRPLINYTFGLGEKQYRNFSYGLDISYRSKDKLSLNIDFERFRGKQTNFIENYLDKFGIYPGRGELQINDNHYLYLDINFRISYKISKFFNLDFGKSRHFIGNGYRSLLLSDNSGNYPFIRLSTNFGKIKYTNLYTTFSDIWDSPLRNKKHATFHYLEIKPLEYLSLGIFEGVIWQAEDSGYNRGYELAYLNPIIFYRPVEFSMGSNKGNVLMGINTIINIKNSNLYGQILLDDLNISRQKDRDNNYSGGFFQNKFAYQLGVKANNIFNIKDLFILAEFNQAQPYTYAHKMRMQNYTHLNQALAHPLGANFREFVGIINYTYNNWSLEIKWNHAIYGDDSTGTHFGKNIFISDYEAQNDGQQYSYGNFNGQGINTTQDFISVNINRKIKEESNTYLYGQLVNRLIHSDLHTLNHLYFIIGVKTNLNNSYFDF